MSKLLSIAAASLLAATLVQPNTAAAAGLVKASCSVTVNYLLNNNLLEPYTRDFVVEQGTDFVDDFSTPTRQKVFSARASKEAGKPTVTMNYFNDVGVFTAIMVDTSVPLKSGAQTASAGRHTFSTSLGVSGNHLTTYSLSCQRL
jgi:hypothetical protein